MPVKPFDNKYDMSFLIPDNIYQTPERIINSIKEREYIQLYGFCENMCLRILKSKDMALDILHGAYSKSKDENRDIKKIVCREIYSLHYKLLADTQLRYGLSNSGKHCAKCKVFKYYPDFRSVFDKRYNFTYYRHKCKKCMSDESKTIEFRNLRKHYYLNNPSYRQKAIKRAVDYNKLNRGKNIL